MQYFNLSYINESSTQIQVQPYKRYNGYSQSDFDLNWTATSFEYDTLYVQLNFKHPYVVSSQAIQDKLVVYFNQSSQYLKCYVNNQAYNLTNQTLFSNVRRQIYQEHVKYFEQVNTLSNGAMIIMIVGAILLLFFYQAIEQWAIFVRFLQFVMHLAMMQIIFPANALQFYEMIFLVSNYDFVSFVDLWNRPFFKDFYFNDDAQIYISLQMQTIAYNDRSAFRGLGSFTFIILRNLFLVIVAGILKLFMYLNVYKQDSKKLYKKVTKNLFFNVFLESTVEGYFSLLICGYLNIKTLESSSSVEIIGALFSFYCLLMTLVIIVIFNFWTCCKKTQKRIDKKSFEDKWGALVNYVRFKFNSSRAFYLVFILRRQIYIEIFLLYRELPGLFLALFLFQNLIYIIYVGWNIHFKSKVLYLQQIFNEMTLAICSSMLTLFTDLVPSQKEQYDFGWIMISVITLSCFINIGIIIYYTIYKIYLVGWKYYNLIDNYYNQKVKQKEQYQVQMVTPNILLQNREYYSIKSQTQNKEGLDIFKQDHNSKEQQNNKYQKVLYNLKLLGSKKQKQLQQNPKQARGLSMSQILEDWNEDEYIVIDQQINKQIENDSENLQVETKLFPIKKKEDLIYKSNMEQQQNNIYNVDEFFQSHKFVQTLNENMNNKVVEIFKILNQKQQNQMIDKHQLQILFAQIEIDILIIKSGTPMKPYFKYLEQELHLENFINELQDLIQQ